MKHRICSTTAQQQFSHSNRKPPSSFDEWVARSDEIEDANELLNDFKPVQFISGLVTQTCGLVKDRVRLAGEHAYDLAKQKVHGVELIVAMSYLIATRPLPTPRDTLFSQGIVAFSYELGAVVEKPVSTPEPEPIYVEPTHLDFGNMVAAPYEILAAARGRDLKLCKLVQEANDRDREQVIRMVDFCAGYDIVLPSSTPLPFNDELIPLEKLATYRLVEGLEQERAKTQKSFELAEAKMRKNFNPYAA